MEEQRFLVLIDYEDNNGKWMNSWEIGCYDNPEEYDDSDNSDGLFVGDVMDYEGASMTIEQAQWAIERHASKAKGRRRYKVLPVPMRAQYEASGDGKLRELPVD